MKAQLRSLASDTIVYGVSTIIGRFLTFLLTPLYTNYVTKSELGDTAYLYSLIAFVNVVYSCGFDSAFFRFFSVESAGRDGEQRGAQTPSEKNRSVFAHSFMGVAVVSVTGTFLICLAPEAYASGLALEASGIILVYAALIALFDALALVPFAALRMESRARRFALLKLAIITVNVSANLYFVVLEKMGIRGIFLSGLLSSFVGLALVTPDIARYVLGGKIVFDAALFRELWRFGLPTVPAAFSAIMLQVADRPILKIFVDSASVGLYQANYRLGIPMMMAVTVFEYAWKPFYLRETARSAATKAERRARSAMLASVLTYFVVGSAFVFLLGALLMEYIVRVPFIGGRFVNPAYWSGLAIVPIVMIAYFFNGLSVNFAVGVYIRKRTRYLPAITGGAALANVALNFALVPVYGPWGAAWATLGAYMVGAALMYRAAFRLYPLPYEWGRIGLALCACACIYAAAIASTRDMSAQAGAVVRGAWICAYPLVLAAFGFFEPSQAKRS
jgi:O-antigen/teichoic acid export membrane protein